MRKRALFVFVIVMFIFASFTGCTKPTDAPSGSQTSQTSQVVSESETSDPEDDLANDPVFGGFLERPGDIDFGGGTIIISSWNGTSGPVTLLEDQSNLEQYNRIKLAEEKYNCTFEYKVVVGEAYADQFASASAAGIKFADIIHAPTLWAFPSWVKNGFFTPLDDILDYTHERYAKQAELSRWIDGKHYYIVNPVINPPVVCYNPDILEREGCPDPVTLAQEGNWTWDAFRDIAVKCTKNVSSATPQYGLRGWFIPQLLHSNGVQQMEVGDGALTSGLFSDAALNALTFYRDLNITKKVMDPADWTIGQANFVNGTVAMTVGELYSYANLRDSMSGFKVVPMPKGDDVEVYTIVSNNIGVFAYSPLSDYDITELVAVHRDASATDDKTNTDTYVDPYKNFKEAAEKNKYFSSDEELNLYWDTMNDAVSIFGPGIDQNIMWKYLVSKPSPMMTGENPATIIETMRNEVLADLEAKMQ